MKIIKNTSANTVPDTDPKTSQRTKTPEAAHPQPPNASPSHDVDAPLPPPIKLADYAATRSLHPLKDSMLAAAQKIVRANPPNPTTHAREQIIALVLKENFKTVLTPHEQNEIAEVLHTILVDDPVFCAEIDNMLEIAGHTLKTDH